VNIGIVFAVGMVLVCAVWMTAALILGNSRQTITRRRVYRKSKQKRFSCVVVQCGSDACQAVKKLAGVRYLGKLAPLLPLWECDVADCGCYYQHFADRRFHDRRELYGSANRMAGRDRRVNRVDRRQSGYVSA
jgi:hypothetical protein